MPHCPPVDNYRFEGDPNSNLPAFPMDLYMCSQCGHAQLLDVVDPDILYGNYIYTSRSSSDLDGHFENYAKKLLSYAGLTPSSLVIDIGSNDGLLLSKFKKLGCVVQGVDPARAIAIIARENGIPTVNDFFTPAVVTELLDTVGTADLVCANNVFSHTDDLRQFAECARAILKPQGIFVFEVSYLRDMIENKVIDYIYHEHLAHHSLQPLKLFFESLGMRLFDVERIPTKGGSIRGYVSLEHARWKEDAVVSNLIEQEVSVRLYDADRYRALQNEFELLKTNVREILYESRVRGNTIASYGASATTTVLNELLSVNEHLSFIVDDNTERHGRLSPGHKIKVHPPKQLLSKMPEYVFISAWRFAKEIISRNSEYIARGGKFLVPLPKLEVFQK